MAGAGLQRLQHLLLQRAGRRLQLWHRARAGEVVAWSAGGAPIRPKRPVRWHVILAEMGHESTPRPPTKHPNPH